MDAAQWNSAKPTAIAAAGAPDRAGGYRTLSLNNMWHSPRVFGRRAVSGSVVPADLTPVIPVATVHRRLAAKCAEIRGPRGLKPRT
jgi:hypothetical protein